ncbi:YcgN family cysteine cluster protein [Aliiglaciecola sp. LCG003]|uniref:YcgN family cysteine cluster protein n=1 Tax=Aliiglaciecola sp. LCG003 TaxID=3053655 RepID=UPI002573E7F7|nr:YcgN family cysteine cluster protein [Aliiglaciecola sp. LCG003]WJG11313.1 YcgN family cysteine cluster protein [Aliiglaciecola sp. LCG003]
MTLAAKFWESKSLEQMNKHEWEAVCDGCAKCCLHKYIDDDAEPNEALQVNPDEPMDELHFTNIVCNLLNTKTCSCTQYAQRSELVPECVTLTKANLNNIDYMPPSCSYRRLREGRGLPSWHPLLNKGKKSEMHKAGMSVRGKTVFDNDADMTHFEDYIVVWPLQDLD